MLKRYVVGKEDLVELIGNAQTLEEAFSELKQKGKPLYISKNLDGPFRILDARKEFVIIRDQRIEGAQYLLPYGGNNLYKFMDEIDVNLG